MLEQVFCHRKTDAAETAAEAAVERAASQAQTSSPRGFGGVHPDGSWRLPRCALRRSCGGKKIAYLPRLIHSKSGRVERWLSGLKRTPGEREWANTPPWVRIPVSPPKFGFPQ